MAVSTGTAILGAAGIGALAGGSKKSGSTQTNVVQDTSPWEPQQGYLQGLMSNAYDVYSKPQYQYNGPKVAGDATRTLQGTLRGDYLTPDSNPFLGQYVNDALGLVKSNFAGQYGGQAGANLGNSGYQEMLTRTLANTALPIYANAYSQERQNQLNATQMASAMDEANVRAPFAPQRAYQQIVGQNYGSSGTQQTQQPYFTNPLATAMGLGIGGLSLYNGMNQAGMFAPSGGTGMSMLGSFPTFA
jgi:hypothetical protein